MEILLIEQMKYQSVFVIDESHCIRSGGMPLDLITDNFVFKRHPTTPIMAFQQQQQKIFARY